MQTNPPLPPTNSTAEPLVMCENLVAVFRIQGQEVLALQGLDLLVRPGELMGIVGVSGSGKTTLLNVLGGLVRPTAGRAIVDGQDLLRLSQGALDEYRQRTVGFVWQQGARNLSPHLTSLENVMYPMALSGVSGSGAKKRAQNLIEAVGLTHRMNHTPPMLSGGEQQRVAIAVALANNPKILLADEPTGELDSVNAQTIYQLFHTLNREMGLTTLIVSHDRGIARHVDRVMTIRDGKTAMETVRVQRQDTHLTAPGTGPLGEYHFEDLVVLDSAGRLQIPKPLRDQLNIHRRVHMEVVDGELHIRTAENRTDADLMDSSAAQIVEEIAALGGARRKASKNQRGIRGAVGRLLTLGQSRRANKDGKND